MEKRMSEKKRFSIIARGRSVKHAIRGLRIILKTQHNAWVHAFFAVLAIVLGFYFDISTAEWSAIILCITTVLASEAFNTAMEIDMDLTSPEYHPYARDTKDIAAGAVLLTVIGSVVVGLIIFIPKIFS
ncbi:MAG TPA: diacylglycerol kinase family protein [Candidatus Paceibacterota bacterium]|nr:diacylglycerol kinase family protein [Candidatus Paceibacterota bacterium]